MCKISSFLGLEKKFSILTISRLFQKQEIQMEKNSFQKQKVFKISLKHLSQEINRFTCNNNFTLYKYFHLLSFIIVYYSEYRLKTEFSRPFFGFKLFAGSDAGGGDFSNSLFFSLSKKGTKCVHNFKWPYIYNNGNFHIFQT